MTKIRFGILGAASVFERRMGPAMQKSTLAEVVHIASRDPARSKKLTAQFGGTASGSYEAVLEDKNVDAIYVPLPNGLHEEWCIRALRAGKHVICEKSLATSYSGAQRIVQTARENSRLLMENFMCGFHLQHCRVSELIRTGAIGQPYFFLSQFGIPHLEAGNIRYDGDLGGGALNDVGAYGVFMTRKTFGLEPVTATFSSFDDGYGVDIRGAATLVFSDGKMASLSFGFGLDYTNRYEVWGDKGKIQVDLAFSIPATAAPSVRVINNNNVTMEDLPTDDQFLNAVNHFSRALADASAYEAYYKEALLQAKAMEMIRRPRGIKSDSPIGKRASE